MARESGERVPWDVKGVSIFLFFSALVCLDVDSNVVVLFGVVLSGAIAELVWAARMLLLLISSYGFWKKKMFCWNLMLGLSAIEFASWAVGRFRASGTREVFRLGEVGATPSQYSTFFVVAAMTYHILFIVYLLRRRPLFE